MAKMSKAARAAARVRRFRERGKRQMGAAALAGSAWLTAGFIGDRMAKDDAAGQPKNFTVAGRTLPSYEAAGLGGLGAMVLFGHKLAPEISGAITGVAAGAAGGAAAVRKYKFRLENPE